MIRLVTTLFFSLFLTGTAMAQSVFFLDAIIDGERQRFLLSDQEDPRNASDTLRPSNAIGLCGLVFYTHQQETKEFLLHNLTTRTPFQITNSSDTLLCHLGPDTNYQPVVRQPRW